MEWARNFINTAATPAKNPVGMAKTIISLLSDKCANIHLFNDLKNNRACVFNLNLISQK